MNTKYKKVLLGEVVKINSSSYSAKDNLKYVNYLDTGNITDNVIDEIQRIDLSIDRLPSRAKRKVKYNSIIYSTVRPNQRHFGIIKEQPKNFLVSTGFAVIDVIEELADADFIYYWLTQNKVVELLHAIAEQSVSAYPSIKPSNIENLEIFLPELSEQKRIASILNVISEKMVVNNSINSNLEQQAQTVFKKCFIDNEANSTWVTGTFSDIIISTLNGDWGKDTPAGYNTQKVYCIRGADIPEVKVGNRGKMPIRYILPKNYDNKKLSNGNIVVEISGGSPTQSTGRCTVITQSLLDRYDSGMVCTNFCKAITPIEGYSMFIYYYWQYLYNKGIFFSYENGTTGIKNLDITGFIETEQIIIPPIVEIVEFNNYCNCIFNKIFANSKENEHLSNIRNTILPRLMSGEIDLANIEF